MVVVTVPSTGSRFVHSTTKSGKAGSLCSRLEHITDAVSPADALIHFANHMSGAGWRVAKRGKAALPFSATQSPIGSPPWREPPSPAGSRRLGTGRPRHCYTAPPSWTPGHGSRIHSQLTKGLRKERQLRASPSVRAYAGEPGLGVFTVEEPSGEATPRVLTQQSLDLSALDLPEVSEAPSTPPRSCRSKSPLGCVDNPYETSLPWSEGELQKVFEKFSAFEEHEVLVEDLPSLLRYLGASASNEEVLELVHQQTIYNSLDYFEFTQFLRCFREVDMQKMRDIFKQGDLDGDGYIDVAELGNMLLQSGYAPTAEATQEAFDVIDEDHSGLICLEEVEKLRQHLQVTRGFLRKEAEEFRMIFNRAASQDNMLPVEELWRIASYLGHRITADELKSITVEVDKNGSGKLSYDEMLQIIRAVRDAEGEKLKNVIGAYVRLQMFSTPSSGRASKFGKVPRRTQKLRSSVTSIIADNHLGDAQSAKASSKLLKVSDIRPAFDTLGYYTSQDITDEILATNLSERKMEHHINCDEAMTFLRAYRRTEGFTQKELVQLREAFDREQSVSVAGHDDNSLDALELGRVLRGFGISRTLQQVHRLIEQVDFDGSGSLTFDEFTKLMRQLFQEEAEQRRDAFNSLDTSHSGNISISRVEEAMTNINNSKPDAGMFDIALQASLGKEIAANGRDEMNMFEFEKFFKAYRHLLMESVATNAGFVPSEVEILRTVFATYDENISGVLQDSGVRRLVQDLIPEASHSKEGKVEVMKWLEELRADHSEGFNFKDFLWLMRKCHDQRDERDIVREAQVVQMFEYAAEEVEGLRHIFSSHIDWTGTVSLEALVKLFEKISPIRDEDVEDLATLVRSISPLRIASVRFPDFLVFMRQVAQTNFLGMNDAAEREVRRQQPKTSRYSMANKKLDKRMKTARRCVTDNLAAKLSVDHQALVETPEDSPRANLPRSSAMSPELTLNRSRTIL